MKRNRPFKRVNLTQYYETDWWKKLSRETRKKRKQCELCGEQEDLHVHHKRYRFYGERPEDLQVLCSECHLKHVHNRKDEMDLLDFNHRNPSNRLQHLIDEAMEHVNSQRVPREYLGGSRIGHGCARALQYEFFNTPKDAGKGFDGKTLRIFSIGHILENLMAEWIRMAGLDLKTHKPDGDQFGFETGKGLIQGHIDGVIIGGLEEFGPYPRLWECKTANAKKWKEMEKLKLKKANPTYYAQCQIYMAYMNLSENPALYTAINKDTAEIYAENIEFDPEAAQALSDKGARIIQACLAGEMLPRATTDPSFHLCHWCPWSDRCWGIGATA